MIVVSPVRTEEALVGTRDLLDEYAEWLGPEIWCMSTWAIERDSLPGVFQPPTGEQLLARAGGDKPVGCVGFRDLGDGVAEMKRLYVRPAGRGSGAGRLLVDGIVDSARQLGFGRMVLDTLADRMPTAITIYRAVGFDEIECYQSDPIPGASFFGLDL